MALIEKQDYILYPSGVMIYSRQPMFKVYVCTITTKNYVFFIPTKIKGMAHVNIENLKANEVFKDVGVEKGLREVISKMESVDELEKWVIEFLDGSEKYVHRIDTKKKFQFSGFFGRGRLTMSESRTKHSTVLVDGKEQRKEFKTFHGQ